MSQFRVLRVRAAMSALAFACVACLAFLAPGSSLAAGDANSSTCPNETLTGFTAALPDCRALEQVTPTYTETSGLGTTAIAEDGSRVLENSLGAFAGDEGGPSTRKTVGVLYDIAKTASGWSTTAVSPANPGFRSAFTWRTASGDLSSTLLDMPSAPAGQENFYTRESNGPLSDVGPINPPADGAIKNPGPEVGVDLTNDPFAGASSDLSHIVFSVQQYGWRNDPTDPLAYNLYEYRGADNAEPSMVAVQGGAGSDELIGLCGATLGGPNNSSSFNAISADGSTIFFTPQTPAGADLSPEVGCGIESAREPGPSLMLLYARVNAAETVPISLPECAAGCAAAPTSDSVFEGASRNGVRVFFLSSQRLTAQGTEDSTPHDSALYQSEQSGGVEGKTGCQEAAGSGCNLYEYDFSRLPGKRLVAVSAGSGAPHVQGVVRISQDGSHVYFVAQGKLTSEPNASHEEATPGANNLYVYEGHPAAGPPRTRFIAALAPSEEETGGRKTSPDEEVWGRETGADQRPAETTPDGRFLVFQSRADLTPDDTSKGVWQVFQYEAEGGPAHEGLLRRVSVGDEGYNGDGNTSEYNATIGRVPQYRAKLGTAGTAPAPQPSGISADGAFVFFQSGDLLAPGGGVSASSGLSKVYEWHAGHVYRVAGGGAAGATLLGTDLSGGDVFFETREPLLPGAPSTPGTVYDARVNGGTAVASPVACSGAGCQGALGPSPVFAPHGSATFSGPGNLAPPPPPAPSVKRTVLSNAQKLAQALKGCRRNKSKKGRATCETRARRTYSRGKR